MPVQGALAPPAPRPAVRPDEGHGTARVRTGFGVRDGRAFVELRARPAFHDLLDPQGGYVHGAQIDFLDLALRAYPGAPDFRVHELRVLDIVSLAPRSELFPSISWRVDTAITSEPVRGRREAYFWRSGGGAGATAALGERALAYAFAEARLDVATQLSPAAALGAGASAGLLLGDARDRWRLHLHGRATQFVAGDVHRTLAARLDQRLSLTRDDALELRLGATSDFGVAWLEAGLFWVRHF
ncbi:MAG: hypothetical protein DCC71_24065 [Proteobacteria bacterium]|nr:MAG: hypothetical protein DCC71_24065 [Pseudomonadota bacterium]